MSYQVIIEPTAFQEIETAYSGSQSGEVHM